MSTQVDGRGEDQSESPVIDRQQQKDARKRASPSAAVVYEAIRTEGQEELGRSTAALAWSGIAAGLSMGFSLVAQGLLRAHLPDAPWTALLWRLGYTMGFLVVVLGRQQLFTENTLTAIIPLLAPPAADEPRRSTAVQVARLWIVVLLSNLAGALVFAWAVARTSAFSPDVQRAFEQIGAEAMRASAASNVLRGVFAGWLIALMVWLLPVARASRVTVIVIITYVVGLGELTHVVAGAVEVFYLPFRGTSTGFASTVARYVGPAFVGNVIGGVTLTAALNHAQVVAGGTRSSQLAR
jgi:formate/nitrite transporter FocA (FNT family)